LIDQSVLVRTCNFDRSHAYVPSPLVDII